MVINKAKKQRGSHLEQSEVTLLTKAYFQIKFIGVELLRNGKCKTTFTKAQHKSRFCFSTIIATCLYSEVPLECHTEPRAFTVPLWWALYRHDTQGNTPHPGRKLCNGLCDDW